MNEKNAMKLGETRKSVKRIRYETDGNGGKYAVVEYFRKGETKPFRTRIIHGA